MGPLPHGSTILSACHHFWFPLASPAQPPLSPQRASLLPAFQCKRTLEPNACISSFLCLYCFPKVTSSTALVVDSAVTGHCCLALTAISAFGAWHHKHNLLTSTNKMNEHTKIHSDQTQAESPQTFMSNLKPSGCKVCMSSFLTGHLFLDVS